MDKLVSPEASIAQKFDRVREAGFDGMAIDLGALTLSRPKRPSLTSPVRDCSVA